MNDTNGTDSAVPFSVSAICLFSVVFAYLLGNLLVTDIAIAAYSARVLLVSLLLFATFFSLLHRTQDLSLSLVSIFIPTMLLGFFDHPFSTPLFYVFTTIGAASYVMQLRAGASLDWSRVVGVSILIALVVISAKSPVSFDMESRILHGDVHRDTLFHASIASMMLHHGTVSTGVGGLVEIPYHVLSHAFIASMSAISHVPVLESYGLITFLFLIPLLITCYAILSWSLAKGYQYHRHLIITAMVLAILPRILKTWGLKESYFGSESYMLALILFAGFLSIIYDRRHRAMDAVSILVLAVLASLSKAPLGIAIGGLYLAHILFFERSGAARVRGSISIVSIAVVLYLLLSSAGETVLMNGADETRAWDYIRGNSLGGELIDGGGLLAIVPVLMFVMMHFLINWTVIYRRLKEAPVSIMSDGPVLYCGLPIIGSMLLIAVSPISGSAMYYFSGVALFVALPWFVSSMAQRDYSRLRSPLLVALIIVLVFKSSKIVDKSMFAREGDPTLSSQHFVQSLMRLRDAAGTEVIYSTGDTSHEFNPVENCMFAPFVFPAVSEAPWTGLLDHECGYEGYGYDAYRIDGSEGWKSTIPVGYQIRSIEL